MIYTIVLRDKIGVITHLISFDTITDFSNSLSANITKNPTEKGFPISDHMTTENEKFDISAIVTNFSFFDDNLELTWNGTNFVNQGGDISDRHLSVEKKLKSLVRDRKVFSLLRTKYNSHLSIAEQKYKNLLHSTIDEYQNCVCSNISFTESAGNEDAIFVKLQIEQIQIATLRFRQMTPEEAQRSLERMVNKPANAVGSNSATSSATGASGEGTTNSLSEDLAKQEQKNVNNAFGQAGKDVGDDSYSKANQAKIDAYSSEVDRNLARTESVNKLSNEINQRLGASK